MKKISVLGSTGSIGTQTLEIVEQNEDLKVVALTCHSNIDLMEKQALKFKPELVSIGTKEAADVLRERLKDTGIEVYYGMEGLEKAATIASADMVVTAFVGMIGIKPTIAAIKAGKDIALANKETLVTAGHIIMPLAKEMRVKILPVDSEHSAIFQSLEQENRGQLEKILLTASGGPFRGKSAEELEKVTLADALAHPNWSMGAKITVDSATLVNKALEVMEAKWLFDVDIDQIEIVVHPQSIIHSMVQYTDGAIMAELGTPDMKVPISYALFYPERRPVEGKRVDFSVLSSLTFEKPDAETFKGLKLGLRAGKTGGSMPVVYNAANEAAVAGFIGGKIGFTKIWELIERAMNEHSLISSPTLDEILEIEKDVRNKIDMWMNER